MDIPIDPVPIFSVPSTPAPLPTEEQSGRFNFLGLAAETRNQIYELLLINSAPINDDFQSSGRFHVVNVVDSPVKRRTGYPPYVRYIEGETQYRGDASKIKHPNSCDYIYPAILQTCKQIAAEGASILYGKNIFGINLTRDWHAPKYLFQKSEVRTRDWYAPEYFGQTVSKRHYSEIARELFQDPNVLLPGLPRYLPELCSASFFNQIGKKNTAMIRHLEFYANNSEDYEVMGLLTELIKQHVTALRTARFYVLPPLDVDFDYEIRTLWRFAYEDAGKPHGEYFSYFNPDDPWLVNPPFFIPYNALKNFVEEITSLEAFRYSGSWCFFTGPVKDKDPAVFIRGADHDVQSWRHAMAETDKLEEIVRVRSEARAKGTGFKIAKLPVNSDVVNHGLNRFTRKRKLPTRVPGLMSESDLGNVVNGLPFQEWERSTR